ncbi:hypothetical protein GCM10011416_12120 [Polaribacter pacificus]|uniref:Secretion system C-terminal sorting domain-containing protein n=1 Tax=Polaribacter pacificus TaxID=1775173 RepID=A0A917HXL2_9FLAO|nr:zinc-dependent metalloprotease [Polaribacter pacificus]GGG95996.1 hypothetical protein GCM10011416_12120 [Polaribacter pacificus]
MKKRLHYFLLGCLLTASPVVSQEFFESIPQVPLTNEQELSARSNTPENYQLYAVNTSLLNNGLVTLAKNNQRVINLPTPLGIQRFTVKEAAVLSDALALEYPQIKSYSGVGLDDPTATIRFSQAADGFHAMISSKNYPVYFIDPYTKDHKILIGYQKSSTKNQDFECFVEDQINAYQQKSTALSKTTANHDGKLRTYRLAVATTAEYSQFHLTNQNIAASATEAQKKAAVLSAINTSMTRVNAIFERDLGVRMQLVANNADLIFFDPLSDGFSNSDADELIKESQAKIDNIIGNANYDVGHTFSTGGGGLAAMGLCLTGVKAKGITGSGSPINDTFDIDFVAHELGHQFGANHTQYNDCQRNSGTAVEPGSASTIMGYAGICEPNVQSSSDAYFHAISIQEMWNLLSGQGSCAVITETGNTPPSAQAGANVTIPSLTPFVLKGAGSDTDADNELTYTWEQIDNTLGFPMAPDASSTGGPMFRSVNPIGNPNRYMPVLDTVLTGKTFSTWEVLPSVTRNLNFRLTVRDNVNATAYDDIKVGVDGNSGPFVVTSHDSNATLQGNSTQTVVWDVANSDVAPVNCSLVNILLSTDGGQTFDTIILTNTPNDGSQLIVLPNVNTSLARIKVEAVNNLFYAVNASNFSIDKTANEEEFIDFALYPNPTKGLLKLEFETVSSKVIINLVDVQGRLIKEDVFEQVPSVFREELNYGQVASGLYLLHIKNGAKQMVKKILIN